MTFNSLLMFDIVFVFFLFLVGVTCLVYYLPPSKQTNPPSNCRHNYNSTVNGNKYSPHHHHRHHHQHCQQQNEQQQQQNLSQHQQEQQHIHHQLQHHHQQQQQQQLQQSHINQSHQHHHHHERQHIERDCHLQHNNHKCVNNYHEHHEYCATNFELLSNNYNRNRIELLTPVYGIIDETLDSMLSPHGSPALRLPPPPPPPASSPSFCYIKAKNSEMKNGSGPIQNV